MMVNVVPRTNYGTDNQDNATPTLGLMRRDHVVHQVVGVVIRYTIVNVMVVSTTERRMA